MSKSRQTKPRRLKGVIGQATTVQVAFVGPLGVGKSTAVRTLSEVPVVSTEVPRSGLPANSRRARKLTTTVGIDYGEWTDESGRKIALLGTPGQARFNDARASALSGHTEVVLFLFGDHEYALEEAREWLQFLGEDTWGRLTVSVTRRETAANPPALERYRAVLDAYSPGIRLTVSDPRVPDSVADVVRTAIAPRKVEPTRAVKEG